MELTSLYNAFQKPLVSIGHIIMDWLPCYIQNCKQLVENFLFRTLIWTMMHVCPYSLPSVWYRILYDFVHLFIPPQRRRGWHNIYYTERLRMTFVCPPLRLFTILILKVQIATVNRYSRNFAEDFSIAWRRFLLVWEKIDSDLNIAIIYLPDLSLNPL